MTGSKQHTEDGEISTRQAAGYKATLKNTHVGEDAKEHAREVLDAAGVVYEDSEGKSHNKDASDSSSKSGDSAGDSEHDHRVMGGYKATLKNDHASEEAKERAREKLDAAGIAHE